jgi:predicted ArsR family transcriptional regulator
VSTPPPDLSTLDLAAAAEQFPRVRDAYEELCLDALAAVRAIIDHGSNEDRVAVAKMLTTSIQKMIAATGQTSTNDQEQVNAAVEARAILDGMWDGI